MREVWEDAYVKSLEEGHPKTRAAYAAGVHRNTPYYQIRRDESFRARVERATGRPVRLSRIFGLVVALLLLAATTAEATITSSPVDLGTAGLTVTVGLRHWQESAPNSWPTASTAGVTVNDLTGGLYTVSGLPVATGTDRYAVTLTAGGTSLFTYSYGAQPGVRVVWQEELALPAAPTTFKAGDTTGSISLVVSRRLPAAACDPGTTATFTAASQSGGAAIITDGAATISNCALDATTTTYGATFTYDIQAGDLATVGKYLGEFQICYSPTSCQTLPSDNRLRFEIVKRLGS
jgi:hypothetical protein